jgi:hypothetical protein
MKPIVCNPVRRAVSFHTDMRGREEGGKRDVSIAVLGEPGEAKERIKKKGVGEAVSVEWIYFTCV